MAYVSDPDKIRLLPPYNQLINNFAGLSWHTTTLFAFVYKNVDPPLLMMADHPVKRAAALRTATK